MKIRKKILPLLLLLVTALLAACGPNSRPAETGEASASGKDAVLGSSREVLRIVSGSENSQLEPLLQEFANQEHIQIEMTYKGSLDIMRLLGDEEIPMTPYGLPAACGFLPEIQNIGSNMQSPSPSPR